MAKRVVLHYGGEKFELQASQEDALDGLDETTGVVSLNAGDGKWLSFVVGQGIPILLETWDDARSAAPQKIR